MKPAAHNGLSVGSSPTFPTNIMESNMSLQFVEPPFPYIDETIKQLEKELDQALWNEDHTRAQRIRSQIQTYEIKLSLGEQFVVSF